MDFLEIAKQRYSVRKYKQQPVEEDKLLKILEAARVAPTGANTQPQRLIVVKEKAGLEKLSKGANIYGAPIGIIVCGDNSAVWKRPFDGKNILDIDVSVVTTHMMLQATELGLGTVWVCYFDPEVIREEFSIPEHIEPINILAIGYGEDNGTLPDRHDKMRKPLKDIVIYK